MSRINELNDPADYQSANGMDTTTPLMNMQPGFVRRAYNSNLGLLSGYIKRSGYVDFLTSVWTGYSIVNGQEFRKNDGTIEMVLAGKSSTNVDLGRIASGGSSVSTFSTGYSTSRPAFVQFGNRMAMFNGSDDPIVYDGNTVRQLGITFPASAPTGVATTGGNLTAGSYVWFYTYYNSVTKAESSPSDAFQAVVSTGDKMTLTVLPGDSGTADTIRIWRTVSGGNEAFLDTTDLISATSIVSEQDDNLLDRPMEIDNSRLEDVTDGKGKYPVVTTTRVFVVTDRNEIRFSKLGFDGPMFESFEAKGFCSTIDRFGDANDIIGLGTVGELIIVIKRRSIGKLQPLTLSQVNSSVDTQTYQYVEISDSVGGVTHFAGGKVENEFIWLTPSMVYATDGNSVRPIAEYFQATIKSLGFSATQLEQISFGNDTKFRRCYFAVFADSNDAAPTLVAVADYQQNSEKGPPNFRWSLYGPGVDSSTHPGIQAGCFIQKGNSVSGGLDMLFGNLALNGHLYKMNTGNTDVGLGIYWEIVTRPHSLSRPNNIKLFKALLGTAQGNGDDYAITMAPIWDLSATEDTGFTQQLIDAASEWDVALWDVDSWASDSTTELRLDVHRKARFVQIVYRQTEASAPVTLYGWNPSASLFKIF